MSTEDIFQQVTSKMSQLEGGQVTDQEAQAALADALAAIEQIGGGNYTDPDSGDEEMMDEFEAGEHDMEGIEGGDLDGGAVNPASKKSRRAARVATRKAALAVVDFNGQTKKKNTDTRTSVQLFGIKMSRAERQVWMDLLPREVLMRVNDWTLRKVTHEKKSVSAREAQRRSLLGKQLAAFSAAAQRVKASANPPKPASYKVTKGSALYLQAVLDPEFVAARRAYQQFMGRV